MKWPFLKKRENKFIKEDNRMHRRAQKAEGTLSRVTFWLECMKRCPTIKNDIYLRSIVDAALAEIEKTTISQEK